MKLKELTSLLLIKDTVGDMNIEITGLEMDSRKITSGNLFICVSGINGFLEDRHQFVEDAVKNGAVALIVERDVNIEIPKIIVKDARYAMAVIASHFYDYPSNKMKLIGITGTNGKTTTSYLLEKILSDYGYHTGLMGNNGVKVGSKWYPTDINTQEPPTLQRNLQMMKNQNVDYCVMEVTSQGLHMERVKGCNFKIAVFTNLTQDHLDYHGTFDEYKHVKGLLFSRLGNDLSTTDKKIAVLNADDPSVEYFKKITSAEVITYGIHNRADVQAKNITLSPKGIRFLVSSFNGEIEVSLNLVGRFNVYNALAAITVALVEGIPLTNISDSLSTLKRIEGRMEIIDENQDFLVIVDYAHTPDALENVLSTISEFSKGKVITVFGCGGDRDAKKRSIMGGIAGSYSDFVFITSDNPRSEDPQAITKDIEKGFSQNNNLNYKVEVDRELAINHAINMASSNDIVLIAGKGHETYQILKDSTIHFDDKEKARQAIINNR
ncbi:MULTISPECIES: UDP-N-acetylmuramoyl-L-alanyl-D-glutamate--2,6-diaminopimelate ligase [Bacillus cereus group]|uniref:UDP-N-acetylmuramoyl-L-alanyl-D-glutamate--2,6-diaminopimelate ligase n=1 Tax=Bacillus thuringiensis subsp. konkukian (strain 97-27) TaxID=281309 RepID=Q6HIC9_BACHK|nr:MULTISPECIES: UDP-N-acetylmuramoyl-L-alanyl-D-glutamate--2,6-diaminopimelate ligase [Bacillus cereus group]AAT59983.1 UDP-N-acetylmuramoylalanyl-D-glutamate--2,6-diaminopimelate ligase [[Bacillus thuringiensis] serovar konkukian str. 97-27]AJI34932.1 UDP-N-acetylmuramyl-tripeptide synthetase family protein [Bacillus thuringiensis]QKI25028.1 UDP-N-acetylmuramoyl-L-alanyl-D-glutamate--2,6-diaminopimelate ligase [Bacillus thuringiensis]TXR58355.1 UDP-N-acetylmuramoyl-L-alanyl-D-glutamate--2,6-d